MKKGKIAVEAPQHVEKEEIQEFDDQELAGIAQLGQDFDDDFESDEGDFVEEPDLEDEG